MKVRWLSFALLILTILTLSGCASSRGGYGYGYRDGRYYPYGLRGPYGPYGQIQRDYRYRVYTNRQYERDRWLERQRQHEWMRNQRKHDRQEHRGREEWRRNR